MIHKLDLTADTNISYWRLLLDSDYTRQLTYVACACAAFDVFRATQLRGCLQPSAPCRQAAV